MCMNSCRFLFLIIAGVLISACGGIISLKKKIVKDYYLMEGEGTKKLGIYYNVQQDTYIGRVPEKVLAYGFNDTVLVAKQVDYNGKKLVYVINMKADSDFAEGSTYLLDTLSEEGYLKKWDQRLRVKFRTIEY
jgi:hypothetical protein